MLPLGKGRLIARLAQTPQDLARAQALRWRAFRAAGQGAGAAEGQDADAFDARCQHLLVQEAGADGALLACCRLLPLASGAAIGTSYAAQFYDLARLTDYPGPMLEVGRFCIRAGCPDPDILRLAWAALTRLVDAGDIQMLFGASSFAGTDPAPYQPAFAHLAAYHLAPARWMPAPKAPELVRLTASPGGGATATGPTAAISPTRDPATHAPAARVPTGDPATRDLATRDLATRDPAAADPFAADPGASPTALSPRAMPPPQVPPLLRSYLAMGGWVSDHAVIDREMQTLHVFTGVEIAAIPPARARLLRALAADAPVRVPA